LSDQLHQAIASLYESAFQSPLESFQQFTFDCVGEVLPFDSGAWMVGVHETNQLNSAFHYQRPAIDVARYLERYGDDDGVRRLSANSPGTPFRIEDTIDLETYRTLPIYQEAGRLGGIEYAMGITLREPVTGLLDFLVLYRADKACPFSDEERTAFKALAPHMAAAWRHRQIVGLFKIAKGAGDGHLVPQRGHGMVDNLGTVFAADPDFAQALSDAFGGWTGTILPSAVKAFIASDDHQASINGLDLLLTRGEQRHILTVSDSASPSPLSEGELRTAKLFAAGNTYHEIAQMLGLSHYTVRNQLSAAYRKLGVHSKVELAAAIVVRT
jgi:DNA-binding CsgD family transcriptional regulator